MNEQVSHNKSRKRTGFVILHRVWKGYRSNFVLKNLYWITIEHWHGMRNGNIDKKIKVLISSFDGLLYRTDWIFKNDINKLIILLLIIIYSIINIKKKIHY